jgi:hypothetical protein
MRIATKRTLCLVPRLGFAIRGARLEHVGRAFFAGIAAVPLHEGITRKRPGVLHLTV